MPWALAKCRRIFLACYERDVKAMRKLILRHDTLFTLARNYDVHADHNIEKILHQHVVSSTKSSIAADGLGDTRPLDQL